MGEIGPEFEFRHEPAVVGSRPARWASKEIPLCVRLTPGEPLKIHAMTEPNPGASPPFVTHGSCARLLLALFLCGCSQPAGDSEALLRRAIRADPRPVEGRLSSNRDYTPWTASRPTWGKDSGAPADPSRGSTAAAVRGEIAGDQHLAGLLDLHRRDYAHAVEALERAAEERPEAEILSDLSAGYLALAQTDRPWLLVDALVTASRAIEAAPRDPASAFNQALALEKLSLVHVSERAWERYLRIEPDRSWRAEGSAHLARLRTPTSARLWEAAKPRILASSSGLDAESVDRQARENSAEIRKLLEIEWLPRAAATLGAPEAKESLAIAKLWSNALARHGERLYVDSIAHLERPRPEASKRRLAEGLQLYAEGLGARTDCSRAEPLFARASILLAGEQSPMARAARLERLTCFYRRLPLIAEPQLVALAAELAPLDYPTLAAKTGKMLGLCEMSDGRYAQAITHYIGAVKRLQPTGDAELVYLEGMLDEAYRFLGERDEMWRHRLPALRAATALGDLRLQHAVLSGLAQELAEDGRREAAIPVLDEMFSIASAWAEPGAKAETLLRRIQLGLTTGNSNQVAADIDRCERVLRGFTQPADRAKLEAELQIAAAERNVEEDPAQVRRELRAALLDLSSKGEGVLLPRALLILARADLALGDLDRAEQDFRQTLRLYEDRRAFATSEIQRIHYFATAQKSFDAMIRFQVMDRGDASAALR
ncbi:MAG TPA: hypothetical protein VN783_16505, partial [Thermoanaerobaculia bacterium]|nr:hypothetical protein [Thermoanaerobaculia bacterium]